MLEKLTIQVSIDLVQNDRELIMPQLTISHHLPLATPLQHEINPDGQHVKQSGIIAIN
jgi:hypothetical protein